MRPYDVTLYHRKTNGTVKVWRCWIVGDYVHSEWGQQDGKMSTTKERGAADLFNKKVKKRKDRGYVEHLDTVVESIEVSGVTMNFDRLPRSFAPAKPFKEFNPAEVAQWEKDGLLYIQRKRDGMRHYLVSDSNGVIRIYSSGKHDMTEHLKPLLTGLELPPQSVLDVELVVTEPGPKAKDGFLTVSGIARSLPKRAREMIALAQRNDEKVQLFAFDLLWWDGDPIYKEVYMKRYRLLSDVIQRMSWKVNGIAVENLVRMPLLTHPGGLKATLAEAIDLVKKNKWEGLVIWRKDQATVVQVNGTPKRVNCWKVKPVGEEDVVALGFEKGKGKNANVVGKFFISDRISEGDGEWVPMGRCGTGLDDKTRREALDWKYPCVIQIEYDQKSEKGFRFPVFIRKRDDKKVSEVGQ